MKLTPLMQLATPATMASLSALQRVKHAVPLVAHANFTINLPAPPLSTLLPLSSHFALARRAQSIAADASKFIAAA